MKTATVTLETLEVLVELARYGLTQHQQRLDRLAPPEDVNDRNDRVALTACINRGMRAVDKAERKVIFS
jgi:hypothetical protein